MTLTGRRLRNTAATLLVSAAVVIAHAAYGFSLRHTGFLSGWTLLGVVLFLALYNLRKKLPFLPLGSSTSWLQLHVYAGWLSVVLFVLHVGVRIPDGGLEITLALLYILVAVSGIVGISLSRYLAVRLTRRGENVIFERIPAFRARLREEAEALVLRAVEETGSMSIADFYADRLRPFLDAPRNFWHHIRESDRGRYKLLAEFATLDRYLNSREREILAEIRERVLAKDDLDYQHALQATLKHWLFVHIPLTYSLLILTLVHVLVVYAFVGDVP